MSSNLNSITEDALVREIRVAEERVGEHRARLRSVEDELGSAERELALLVELARLRGIQPKGVANGEPALGEPGGSAELPRVSYAVGRRGAPERVALVRVVEEILRERGEPVAIRELMTEVLARGAAIPGRGEQANLISVISRAPSIVRPARGQYALSEWGVAEQKPRPSKKQVRRRQRKPR